MAISRRSAHILMAILGAVLNPASVAAAHADTTELVCNQPNDVDKFYVSLDLGSKTVTAWITPFLRSQVTPVTAQVTDSAVTWTMPSGAGTSSVTLDRNTGQMTIVRPNGKDDVWTCVRATPVF